MSSDGVSQLLYADTRNYLIFASDLQKSLIEDVVFIAVDKRGDVSDH